MRLSKERMPMREFYQYVVYGSSIVEGLSNAILFQASRRYSERLGKRAFGVSSDPRPLSPQMVGSVQAVVIEPVGAGQHPYTGMPYPSLLAVVHTLPGEQVNV